MGAAPQFWIPPGTCSQDRMGAAPFYPCFLCFFHHPQEFLSLEGRPPFYLFKKAAPRKFWILKVFSSPAALPSVKGWWNEAFQTKLVFSLFVKDMVLLLRHMLLTMHINNITSITFITRMSTEQLVLNKEIPLLPILPWLPWLPVFLPCSQSSLTMLITNITNITSIIFITNMSRWS